MSFLSNVKNEPFNKGDWYKFFIESDGTQIKITTSDLPDTVLELPYLKLPKDFHMIQRLYDIHSTATTSSYDFYNDTRYYEDNIYIYLPDADVFDYMDLYIFGYQG